MGLLQEEYNLKTLPLNVSYFIHLFHWGLEGWWNAASVETAVIFSQKHCLYRIPSGLQGGPKPYCTISQIISVCVLDPKREEMKHNHFVGCEGGRCIPAPRAWLGGSDLGWVPASRDQIHTTLVCTRQQITELRVLPLDFPPGETKIISVQRPYEVIKPLSLTNIIDCNFNISLHLQTSVVLKRTKHYFFLPSSRINQEPQWQLQRLMWEQPTFTAKHPDISLLSN